LEVWYSPQVGQQEPHQQQDHQDRHLQEGLVVMAALLLAWLHQQQDQPDQRNINFH